MPFARKIVLHCLLGYDPRLDALGEELIRDGVHFVGVVGRDCERVEDIIAELVVGHGSRDRCLLTSSHPGEFLQAAIAFARVLGLEFAGSGVGVFEQWPALPDVPSDGHTILRHPALALVPHERNLHAFAAGV